MLKDLDRVLLASLEEPGIVGAMRIAVLSTPIPNAFIMYMMPQLSGIATKVYLALAMSLPMGSHPGGGSVIDHLGEFTGLGRGSVMEALEELTRRDLIRQVKRYLRDSSAPGDWRLDMDDTYRLETSPAILLQMDPNAIMTLAGAANEPAVKAEVRKPVHTPAVSPVPPALREVSKAEVAGSVPEPVRIQDQISASDPIPETAPSPDDNAKDEEKAIEIQALITGSFRVAQELLVTIGNREMRQIELWLRRYGYGPDMVRLILSHCISKNKRDIGYASAVAREWHKEGLKNTGDVTVYLDKYEETRGRYARIRKLMGRHDGLTQAEKELYDIWTAGWGFSDEMVASACKTTTKARTPSFDYVNSVLESWKGQGITTLEQAQADMDKHKNMKQTSGRPGARSGAHAQGNRVPGGSTAGRKPEDVKYYADFARMEEELLDSEGTGD